MRETRVQLSDIRLGEMVVRIGTREIGARFVALHDCKPGTPARGPRGGQYQLTAEGARKYAVVETYASRPLVARTATATVLRDTEETS